MLFRPATLFMALKGLLLLATLILPAPLWARAALGLMLLTDVAYYVGGLWLIPVAQRPLYVRALWRAPVYLWVWLSSLWLAWRERGKGRWLSVRHE